MTLIQGGRTLSADINGSQGSVFGDLDRQEYRVSIPLVILRSLVGVTDNRTLQVGNS